ncbi:MAG: stage sporulation protein [Bacilli bacterium]|nr:stage sporulation protein [Bacilli bacterium]
MKRRQLILAGLICLCFCAWFGFSSPGQAFADQTNNLSLPTNASSTASQNQTQSQAGGGSAIPPDVSQFVDTSQLDNSWDQLSRQYSGYLPSGSSSVLDTLRSGNFTLQGVLTGLLRYLFDEIVKNSKLLATIILLAVFAAILENMKSALEQTTVSKVAFAVSYLVLIVLAINSFTTATGYAKDAIQSMVDFMMATIPLLLALLASTGSVSSVAMMHPLILFTINAVSELVGTLIFPLLFFSAVLEIVSVLSDKYQVTRLANFLRNCAIALLGVFLSVFLGVVSVKGAAGAVVDGVTLRTAKYVSSTFIPVVGKMFSDAADTVMGASLLVKNAVGLAGVLVLLLICAFPAIKIISLALIYHLSAAMLQPLGDTPVINSLSIMGKCLVLVFAALATVGMMFFLAITILIAAGNLTTMVR